MQRLKVWMDENYRFIMLLGMGVEIYLIGWLVYLAKVEIVLLMELGRR